MGTPPVYLWFSFLFVMEDLSQSTIFTPSLYFNTFGNPLCRYVLLSLNLFTERTIRDGRGSLQREV